MKPANLARFCVLATLLAAHPGRALAEDPGVVDGAVAPSLGDAVDVLCVATQRPLVVRLHVLVDGVGYRAAWQAYVERLFNELDADRDGELNSLEARRIPAPEPWAQDNGQDAAGVPARNESENVDVDPADGRITRREFSDHFNRSGGAAVVAGLIGSAPSANRGLSAQNAIDAENQLAKHLDQDSNGKLAPKEFADGAQTLALLDLDDDGTFNRSELAPLGDPYGVVSQQMRQAAGDSVPFIVLSADASRDQIVQRLLTQFDKSESPPPGVADAQDAAIQDRRLSRTEFALASEAFDLFDFDGDGRLDVDELFEFVGRPRADLEFTIRLGERRTDEPLAEASTAARAPEPNGPAVRLAADGMATIVVDTVQIEIGADGASPEPQAARAAYLRQFQAADKDQNDYLESGEAERTPFGDQRFAMLDRDGDGKLFRSEALAWFDEREASAKSRVALTIAANGRNLFEIIDANRDGRLGPRELAAAAHRLSMWDAGGDGELDYAEIPNHFRISIGRGQPNLAASMTPVATLAPPGAQAAGPFGQGPAWFHKMDRNRDGEISAREFLGAPGLFKKLDVNGDGALDQNEATAVAAESQSPAM